MSSIDAQSADRHFSVEHLKVDLRRRSLRSAAVTMTSEAVKFVLNFGSIAVLARILAKDDFGLFAMVTATLAFISFIKDFGLSTAVQQRENVTHEQLSTLFWFNVAISLALAGIVAGAAPVIAWFYERPEALTVCLAWASIPLLDGLGMQHQSLLARQMRFGTLASIEIASLLVSIAAAILAASMNAGVWALMVMQVVRSAVFLAAVWMASGWRPSRPRRGTGVRPMLAFGGSLTLCSLLDYVWRDLDKIILGRMGGAVVLGLYSNAQKLMMLPLQQLSAPLGRVALPALSRVADDSDRYRQAYTQAVSLMMRVMMPAIAIALFWGDSLVPLALGPEWTGAVVFFQILAVASLPRPLSSVAGWLLLTRAQGGRQLKFRIATLWVTPALFIAGGMLDGARGIAIASACSAWLLMVPFVIFAERGTGIGVFNMFKPAMAPMAAAVMASAIVRLLVPMGDALAAGLVLMPVLYLAFLCAAAGGLSPLREIEQSISLVLKRVPT